MAKLERLRSILASLDHYSGDGLEVENLQWMLRVGACSYQYEEFLEWLELELNTLCTLHELDWVQDLLTKLRRSRLQLPNEDYGKLDGITYRCESMQMLVLMLRVAIDRQSLHANRGKCTSASTKLWHDERELLAQALKKHKEKL